MMSELYKKLLEARKAMSFEKEYNKELKYEILDADTILEMVGNALAEQGILFVPSIVHAEMTFEAREKTNRDNTVYVQHVQHALATIELRFIDTDTGELLEATTHGSAIDFGDKALGKAQTYAIKYFFTRMFLKGKSDHNDEEKIDNTERAKPARPKATQDRKTAPPANDSGPRSNTANDGYEQSGSGTFPTIGEYWPNAADSLLNMQIKDWHDGLPPVGGIVYGPREQLGYKSDGHVKKALGLKSSFDFDGTLGELLNAVLAKAPKFIEENA